MERQARKSDGLGQRFRLERRDLWQPLADRQGDDGHELEWSSVLRVANGEVRPLLKGRSQRVGFRSAGCRFHPVDPRRQSPSPQRFPQRHRHRRAPQTKRRRSLENPVTQDFTNTVLQRAIKQIVACFPVYRTYIKFDSDQDSDDWRDLDWALTQARRFDPNIDPSVFDFLRNLLSGRLTAAPKSGFNRTTVLRLAMKLQQYSGPVMAKGLEDTAFYRYNRFIALNEVGGEPARFGISAGAFHKANAQRATRWPAAMLATSTHDTKRGEDARARLAVLADMPKEWARQVEGWSRLIRAHRGEIDNDTLPDRNDEYLLYQL